MKILFKLGSVLLFVGLFILALSFIVRTIESTESFFWKAVIVFWWGVCFRIITSKIGRVEVEVVEIKKGKEKEK